MFSRFAVVATAVLAIAVFTVPFSARADDAASLLAKHRAYVGWQLGDGTITTLRISGRFVRQTAGGDIVRTWTTIEQGPIFRTVGTGQNGSYDYGFTGNVFWSSDENGFTHPDYSPNQAYQISRTVLFSEATNELAGTLGETRQLADGTYPVVRIMPPHGDAIDLYVDPATGAYKRAVIDPGGNYETTFDILAYADALPGKRMISRYVVDGGPGINELVKIEANVPIDLQQFHPPAQTATWAFANPNPFRVDVKAHGIYVEAAINGLKGRFLLDTGSAAVAVDSGFAQRAGLDVIRRISVNQIGGEMGAEVRKAKTIELGGNTLSNVTVASGDFADERDGAHIDGFIGYPLFGGAVVTLNTGDQTLQISDPASAAIDPNAGYKVIADLSDGTPVVPMVIDGNVKVNVTLDTGNGVFLLLSPQIISHRHVPFLVNDNAASVSDDPLSRESYYASHLTITGASGGSRQVRCATIGSIALGPIDYRNTFACADPELPETDVIMGYDFLRQFDYVFDYPQGIIMMKPHPQ